MTFESNLKRCANFDRFNLNYQIMDKENPEYNPPIDLMLRDLRKDQNIIIIFVGRQGSGKSYFSFYMAWLFNKFFFKLEPAFSIKDIYWSIEDFSKAMLKEERKFIVLEETSLSLSSKDWYADTNRAFNRIVDTFRISKVSLCLNLPYIFDLDKGTRLKGNYLFKTQKYGDKVVFAFFHDKWVSRTTEKAYFRYKGLLKDIPMIPDGEFDFKEYEKLKIEFNKKEYTAISDKLKPKADRIKQEETKTLIKVTGLSS